MVNGGGSVGGGRYRGDISLVMEALERQATAFDLSRAVQFPRVAD